MRFMFFITSMAMCFGLVLGSCKRESKIIATVGSFQITEQDVKLRNQVNRVYFPDDKRDIGLLQLSEAYRVAQILKNNGVTLETSVLKQEAKRIESNSLAPETLSKIRSIFADEDEYLRIYVLPIYAQRVIYFEFFLQNPKVQAEAQKPAEDFVSKVLANPKHFEKEAKRRNLLVENLAASLEKGVWSRDSKKDKKPSVVESNMPPDMREKMQSEAREARLGEAKNWIEDVFTHLKPGQVGPGLIDRGDHWQVLQYVGLDPKDKKVHWFNVVSFNKADYQKWLEAELAKVP